MIELQELIIENYNRLYNFILGQIRNPYDAEDVLTETIIIAINKYTSLKDCTKTISWLYGIARNIVRRYHHKNAVVSLSDHYETQDCETVPMLETIIQAEEFGDIRKSLSTLAHDYRTVMIERYIKGKSYNQISGELSIPVSLISYRVSEGKRILKEEFLKLDTYIKNGYYEPHDMQIDIRYCGKGNEHNKSYRAMDSLLAKNIAFVCYEQPLSVTDISRIMGVPADYIEETITKMLHGKCLEQKSNHFQTAFPIITEEMLKKIKTMVKEIGEENYKIILSEIYALYPQVSALVPDKKQAAYFIWDIMNQFGNNSPYDTGFEYPCKENDDNWVVKAYAPNSEEVSFPINKYIIEGVVEDYNVVMSFHFDMDKYPLWADIANSPECLKAIFDIANGSADIPSDTKLTLQKAGIIDESIKISCLYFPSFDEFYKIGSIAKQAAKTEYDLIASSKENLIENVKELFPKRFNNIEPYINCEIRNFIMIGFEEFAIKENVFIPIPYIEILPAPVKNKTGNTTMY